MEKNPFNYTTEESTALDEKMEHPELEVVCPRCGKLLAYTKYPSAISVACETPGCIHASLRGI